MIGEFYIIDFSYDVEDNKPIIYIWCIDKEGNRVAVLEKNFRPYFYVILEEGIKVENVIEEIKRLSNSASPITKIEPSERKYYGKPAKTLKIETVIPAYVRVYRDQVSRINGVKEVVEADIRFYMRYSIDKNLKPFTWFRAEVDETKDDRLRVKKVYELKRLLEVYEGDPPELRIMSFDIEVYNKYGSPNPRRDPIILIGIWTREGGKQFVTEDGDDLKTIREFAKFILEYDPDIILGYNSNAFDWPYIIERSRLRNIKLDIGRKINSEPSQGTYGHYSIVGRLNVDLIGFAMGIEEVKVKSLDNIADYLGVLPKSKRVSLEWYQIPEHWTDQKKRPILLQYNLDDAKSTYLLKDAFLPLGEQLTVISGLPLDQLCMASVGYRVEWLMMREAYVHNEIIPNRVEREYEGYKGGLVISPKPGIHEKVYVLDFSSMYPSIMIKYNIGPDTLVRDACNDCWVAPEVGHKFRRSPDGFYKTILQKLLSERKQVKEKLKSVNNDYEKRRLDERQKALKIMANAFYGYMGWIGARWYSKEGAEAVTAWGREIISKVAKLAESKGFEVIYGDTDSIFIKSDDEEKINKFIDEISEKFELEIKLDKKYQKVFFTENKKRYAGLTEDGKIDIVGFEAIRGDWCELAKDLQRDVIVKVLTANVKDAVKLVRETVMRLRRKEFNIEELVIWKSLDKDLDEYEVDSPHVIAAKKAMKAGYLIFKGGKIGYVIVKGGGKVSERAEPYFMVKDKNRIDVDYYIDRQIIPSALRILEQFGISEAALKGGGIDIMDFFNRK